MRNTVLLCIIFVISTMALQAQSTSLLPDPGQGSGKASGPGVLTGCLQTATGGYTLTEDDGTTHDLSGGGSKLRPHVGQEVEITGKERIRTIDNTLPGGASSVVELAVFEVKNVKQVQGQCR